MTERSIDFGWGRDPLNIQLDNLGLDFNSQAIMGLEADMAAGIRLRVRGFLPDAVWRDCVKRMTRAIEKEIRGPVAPEEASPRQVSPPIREALSPTVNPIQEKT